MVDDGSAVPPITDSKPGPWGRLEYTRVNLELPDESVSLPPKDLPPIRWFFQGYSKQQALEFP